MKQTSVDVGRWRIHPVSFALAATLVVGGFMAMLAATREPSNYYWSSLIESSFTLGILLLFLGLWLAPRAADSPA